MAVPASREHVTLNERAIESLEFIRTTMARSAPFTAVPGVGGMGMGLVACAAAVFAWQQPNDWRWLLVWMGAAVVAVPMGLVAMRIKARRHGIGLWSAADRRFAQGFLPAVSAAAVLTLVLARAERFELLPAIWLLSYGAGVLAGSVSSVSLLAWLGALFMSAGTAAAFTDPAWRDVWLGIGFGGLQVVFGFLIARSHGG